MDVPVALVGGGAAGVAAVLMVDLVAARSRGQVSLAVETEGSLTARRSRQ